MNRPLRRLAVAALLLLAFSSCTTSSPSVNDARPKNVILFIGDGMGPAHVTLMRYLRGDEFATGTMPVAAFVTTRSANNAVTDSGAGGTALATGVKTNNHMLAMTPDGKSVPTAAERAMKLGRAAGLVTTSQFFDATPASFSAHAVERYNYPDVAPQVVRSGAEVIIGAGLNDFAKAGMPSLAALAKDNGYTLVTSPADVATAPPGKLLASFNGQEDDLDNPDAPLPALTKLAIERLSRNRAGFFLLVEQEGTDSSSHNDHTENVEKALVSLDKAVAVGLDFAKRDGHTLVIVTADHETGALRLVQEKGELKPEWGTKEHTAVSVPLFAFGPGSSAFAGFLDNTDVGRKLNEIEGAPSR